MATPIPMEGTSLTVLTSHYALLEDAVTTQLGPLAGRIVRKLGERGNMTLKEVSQSLLNEPFQASTTALEAARAVGSNLHISEEASSSLPHGRNRSSSSRQSLEPAVLIDTAVKEIVTRLLLHRVVAATEYQSTYELRLGCGVLLHVLHPLVAQAARERYGPAGESLTLVLRQLAVVPLDAAVKLTRERCPSLSLTEVRLAALAMEADGWVEDVSSGESQAAADAAVSRKRKRDENAAAAAAQLSDSPCRLSLSCIVRELLHDALSQWVAEHFPDGGLSVAIVSFLLRSMYTPLDPAHEAALTSQSTQRDTTGSGEEGSLVTNPFGFPPLALAAASEAMSPVAIAHGLAQQAAPEGTEDRDGGPLARVGTAAVAAALAKMALPTSGNGGIEGPIVDATSSGVAGGGAAESYTLSLSAAVSALQLDCCERTTFSRHGVLGVRLVKLLLKHHFLEDKTLSEEAVATQPRTRHTLSAMMRDGYTFQQEVPRTAITGERQPKNSTFLWGCSMKQTLLPSVREQLANSLLHAIAKLREVVHQANSSVNGLREADWNALAAPGAAVARGASVAGSMHGLVQASGEVKPDLERIRRAVREQRNAIGLESCAMALMRMLLVVDYFQ